MASSVRLVCFDLGRVLVRICDDWKQACKLAGIKVKARDLDVAGKAALWELVIAAEVGRMEQDEFCLRAGRLFEVDAQQVMAMSNAYLLGLYPGVVELIDEVRALGMKAACLSNTNSNHWRIMSDRNSTSCVPMAKLNYQFASHLIGQRKPDKAIYEHVERVASMQGEQIVFFDDVKENVEAAKVRGWTAHLIVKDNDPVRQIRRHLTLGGVLPKATP